MLLIDSGLFWQQNTAKLLVKAKSRDCWPFMYISPPQMVDNRHLSFFFKYGVYNSPNIASLMP